nr:MAG TPA: hypothetical protein [Caudoviricetes sp.]
MQSLARKPLPLSLLGAIIKARPPTQDRRTTVMGNTTASLTREQLFGGG